MSANRSVSLVFMMLDCVCCLNSGLLLTSCMNLENNPIYIEVFGLLDSKHRSLNQLDIRMLINTKLRHM